MACECQGPGRAMRARRAEFAGGACQSAQAERDGIERLAAPARRRAGRGKRGTAQGQTRKEPLRAGAAPAPQGPWVGG